MLPAIPDPLHPAIVHFPVALATLIPLLAVAAAWTIRSGRMPRTLWVGMAAVQILLFASAWAALETGEDQEDTVERVVAERYIEEHEEGAERFLWVAGGATAVMLLGLLGGRAGEIGRWVACAASLGVLAAVVPVGHSGGALVYEHGAASAYTESAESAGSAGSAAGAPPADQHDDDD